MICTLLRQAHQCYPFRPRPHDVLLVELLPDPPCPCCRFCMGTMSQIFQDRVFEEHVAFSGADRRSNVRNEMDLSAFLDFLLAWENRDTPQAAKYFFKVLDIRGQGYLTQVGGIRSSSVCAGPARGPGRAGRHPRQASCVLRGMQSRGQGCLAQVRKVPGQAWLSYQGAAQQGWLTEVRGMCSVSNVLAYDVCRHLTWSVLLQAFVDQAVLRKLVVSLHNLQVEIYTFFKAIYRMWVACGQYSELDPLDVKDELFDLVKPRDPLRITLQDLVVSAMFLTLVFCVTSRRKQNSAYGLQQSGTSASSAAQQQADPRADEVPVG